MKAHLRVPAGRKKLNEALAAEITPGEIADGLVFVARGRSVVDEWEEVAGELGEAFDLTKKAAQAGAPVVYVVAAEDLLGQRGAGPAMVACGLLSGARTLAFETQKAGVAVNVIAPEEGTPDEIVGRWARRMLEPRGPSGELIRLGGNHLGKALP